MSGNLLTTASTVVCPHGGQATALPAQSRVLVAGAPAATEADLYTVVGCTLTVGGKPQPCTTIRWTGPSGRIRINGSPALLQSSTGQCHSAEQVPQGPPNVTVVQQRGVGA
ncbi:hypothetical protein E1265_09310 [Streptomyces sp. 8K308]|uniref:hypothetical protein n=1 Tax=Streptomyces sp. 8K308 TaxID=2530388 RepID=UPI00104DAC5D|nr:hypothetical protein [Streptomyces sp. 8K308]TDC24601.1 hypothetical protein E1265_09310 [Streptomyces sp. 8K308]